MLMSTPAMLIAIQGEAELLLRLEGVVLAVEPKIT